MNNNPNQREAFINNLILIARNNILNANKINNINYDNRPLKIDILDPIYSKEYKHDLLNNKLQIKRKYFHYIHYTLYPFYYD